MEYREARWLEDPWNGLLFTALAVELRASHTVGQYCINEPHSQPQMSIVCLFFIFVTVSLCSPGYPRTHSVDQACLKLRNPPASASQVLGLKSCATTARQLLSLYPTGLHLHANTRVLCLWSSLGVFWSSVLGCYSIGCREGSMTVVSSVLEEWVYVSKVKSNTHALSLM